MSLQTRTESTGVMTVRQDNELGRTTMHLSVEEQRALLTALTEAEEQRQQKAEAEQNAKIAAEHARLSGGSL